MGEKPRQGTTLHQWILSDIEGRIVSGEWQPGHRLPFEVDLAKSYDVSRMTVNKVLTQLAKAGLIERRKRSGSFVSRPRMQLAILEIQDIAAEVRSMGQAYSYEINAVAVREAKPADRAAMELPGTSRVVEVACIHFANATPFCVEDRLINLDAVPEAAAADFSLTPPGEWLMKQTPWDAAEHRIVAAAASNRISDMLGLPAQAPCLVVHRRTWNGRGTVTAVRFSYPGDSHAIVARFTPASAS